MDLGIDVNAQSKSIFDYARDTPLHRACMRGKTSTVRLLLTRGANPSALDDDDKTPLDYAVENQHVKVVKLL